MRIPVNLSSEPFRRDRPMLVASGACAVALAALLGVLIFLIFSSRGRAKDTRVAVAQLSSELRSMSTEQAQLNQFLRQPANAEVLIRSTMLNELIERKSISWTRIFADLESVMPYNIRLVQVRLPQINSRHQVTLDMIVGAQDPNHVFGLFDRLAASPLFGPVTPHSVTAPSQNQPLYQYSMSVDYAQKL
jgi:Tfp pilus assembly protein PilN